MPAPAAPAATPTPVDASQTQDWFAAAPEDSFDKLFENTEGAIAVDTPAEPPVASPATQPASDEPFIKASTGTVYKTREDAVKGIETKDATIEQLRKLVVERTGVDPLTGRPVPPVVQPPQSYLEDRKRYYTDLRTAVETNNEEAYFNAQAKLVADMLQPYLPVVTSTAKAQALRSLPDPIQQYVGTPDYEASLKEVPLLANAIQAAEQNPNMFQQLPDLYRLAYAQNISRKLPELTKGAQTPPSPAPRPAAAPTTLTPMTGGSTAAPSLATSAGRKAIIENAIARGIADIKF